MAHIFRPPIVTYRWPYGLGLTFPDDKGVSVLITNGVAVEQQYPNEEQAAAADYFYRGGTENVLSDAEVTLLTNLGYADRITEI